jgi:hypothetical protein
LKFCLYRLTISWRLPLGTLYLTVGKGCLKLERKALPFFALPSQRGAQQGHRLAAPSGALNERIVLLV